MINGPSKQTRAASQANVAARMRAGLLRQLSAAPLSEWPHALAQCLDSLATYGLGPPSEAIELQRLERDTTGRRHHASSAQPLSRWRDATAAAGLALRPSAHVRWICGFLRAHYGERISLDRVAAHVGRNREYVATLFRRQTGTTIHRYLTRVRMRRAAALLRRSEKVEAVMLLVGYRSKKNFYRQFETAFGVTPGQYKATRLREPAG